MAQSAILFFQSDARFITQLEDLNGTKCAVSNLQRSKCSKVYTRKKNNFVDGVFYTIVWIEATFGLVSLY